MAMTNLSPAIDFFLERAGFSFDPATETAEEGKLRAANALAAAEAWAADPANEVSIDWERDYEADLDDNCDCGEDHGPNYVGIVYVAGEVKASLGAVTFGEDGLNDPYRRVVEAELASEAMEEDALVPGEEPDMRAHRLAEAIVDAMLEAPSLDLSVYNAARAVLIKEFAS